MMPPEDRALVALGALAIVCVVIVIALALLLTSASCGRLDTGIVV